MDSQKYFRMIIALIIFSVLILTAGADAVRVISYGKDLTESQREQVYQLFELQPAEKNLIAVTEVSNREEREYLKGLVDPAVIGSKAISCAYVELLPKGSGIQVRTKNISWVTPEMYASALATARVKDAKIIAAAPFRVSGTAALTGVFKAFESATGVTLSRTAKDTANEEMVRTGEIGESIGDKEKAANLIIRIKEEVLRRDLKDPAEIRQVIINVSNELNINLSTEQISQLTKLMQKINNLNLSASDIQSQLKGIRARLDEIAAQGEGIRGLLQHLIDLISRILAGIRSLLGILPVGICPLTMKS